MNNKNTKIKERPVRFKAPLYVKCKLRASKKIFSAIAKDISMKGIKLLIERPRTVKTQAPLMINILLPSKSLKVRGKTKWIKSYPDRTEAGISILEAPSTYKADILSYITQYYPYELTRENKENNLQSLP